MKVEAEIHMIDPQGIVRDFQDGFFSSDVEITLAQDPNLICIRGQKEEVIKCLIDELGVDPEEAESFITFDDLKEQSILNKFIELIVEKKMREADVSDGSRVPHGSTKHIKDLKKRISDLNMWRNKHKRGTDARANYTRIIQRLKSELRSALRK